MREEIIRNLDNPAQLERLYRENKTTFKKEFNLIYPGIRENAVAQAWHERLNYENDEITWRQTCVRKKTLFIALNPPKRSLGVRP